MKRSFNMLHGGLIIWRPFLSALIVPFVMFAIVSGILYVTVERDIINRAGAELYQAQEAVEIRFESVERLAVQVASSSEVKQFMESGDRNELSDYGICAYLGEVTRRDDIVEDVFVYFEKQGIVATAEAVYSLDEFLSESKISGDINLEEIITGGDAYGIYGGGVVETAEESYSAILYFNSMPLENLRNYNGKVMTLLRADNISRIPSTAASYDGFAVISDRSGSVIEILDSNGTVNLGGEDAKRLFSGRKSIRLAGKKYRVIHIDDEKHRWEYTLAISPHVFTSHKLLFIMLAVMLAAGILSIEIAYIIIANQRKHVKSIAGLIDADNSAGGLDTVSSNIKSVLSDYEVMKEKVGVQRDFIKQSLFERLTDDSFDSAEFEEYMEYSGINIGGDAFAAVAMKIEVFELGKRDRTLLVHREIEEQLEEFAKEEKNINSMCGIGENTYIMLFEFFGLSKRKCALSVEETLKRLLPLLMSNRSVQIFAAADGIAEDESELGRIFRQARMLMDYKYINHKFEPLWYGDLKSGLPGFKYDISDETKIINMTLSGNFEDVKNLLGQIFENNSAPEFGDSGGVQFLTAIANTARRAAELVGVYDEVSMLIKETESAETREKSFRCAVDVFELICKSVNEKDEEKIDAAIEDIQDYIRKNYKDADMSLTKIAEKFAITPKHLSYIYKKYTGGTISSYIEKIRIEEACKLLSETDLSIVKIREAVGFWSETTFRRAFKKLVAESPAEYRKKYSD